MQTNSNNVFRFNLNQPELTGCKLNGKETYAPGSFEELIKFGIGLAQKFYGPKAREVALYSEQPLQEEIIFNGFEKTKEKENDYLGTASDIEKEYEPFRSYVPNKKDWSNACTIASGIGLFIGTVSATLVIAGFITKVMGG